MRYVFIGCTIVLLFSCKSSDSDNEKLKKRIDAMLVDITNEQLPASIRVDGILVEALRWGDTTGINILVTSERDYYDEKNSETSKELYAAQYVKKDTGYDLIWKSEEVERSCSFDITAEFIYKGTTVTDWDKDGIAEVTMLVRLACRSDVSPAVMKLIMHEGQDVYVLKGLSWIRSSPEDSFTVTEQNSNLETLPGYSKTEDEYMKTFGRYESEKGFASAPPGFLAYARQQWMKFVKEFTE